MKDKKSLLEENGLRACVLGDSPPDGLRALTALGTVLRQPAPAAAARRTADADRPRPGLADLAFQLRQDGRTADVNLDQAQCLLQVTTRLTDDGRMTLQFAPAVRHGPPVSMPRP